MQAGDGIRVLTVTGVQTCALPISRRTRGTLGHERIVSSVDTILSSMTSASPGPSDPRARSVLIIGSEALPFAKTDRKSTRLNSGHSQISYAVFCLKKKKKKKHK